jgi:hypothetical protein
VLEFFVPFCHQRYFLSYWTACLVQIFKSGFNICIQPVVLYMSSSFGLLGVESRDFSERNYLFFLAKYTLINYAATVNIHYSENCVQNLGLLSALSRERACLHVVKVLGCSTCLLVLGCCVTRFFSERNYFFFLAKYTLINYAATVNIHYSENCVQNLGLLSALERESLSACTQQVQSDLSYATSCKKIYQRYKAYF